MSGLQGVQALFDGEPYLVPGVLRGFRTWGGLTRDGCLVSTGMAYAWRVAPFGGHPETARCLRSMGMPQHAEQAPGRDCPCGLYGWYAPDDVRIVPAPIVGVVQASGRVILGEHGFRAERLEVLGVTTEPGCARELELLRQLGYPAFEDRAAMVEAFPPDDVSGLVDHRCDGRCGEDQWNPFSHQVHVHLAASSAQMQQAIQSSMRALAQTMGVSISAAVAAAEAVVAGFSADDEDEDEGPPPLDPRARALRARQRRGTGPRPLPLFRQAVRAARRGIRP